MVKKNRTELKVKQEMRTQTKGKRAWKKTAIEINA
jgi:hypothetical protein